MVFSLNFTGGCSSFSSFKSSEEVDIHMEDLWAIDGFYDF
jgi:hypothetical protein